jgi:ABC-type branched-subunit amino acid transport system ATPase component
MNPLLQVENLNVFYNKRQILKNVSLNLGKGEIVGIIGPNGCGKTTLLNALSGFAKTNPGSILLEEKDISVLAPYERARIGIGRSFQNAGVFKEMTLEENLMLVLEKQSRFPWYWMVSGHFKKLMSTAVDEALESVGLLNHKKLSAGLLSGGQLRLLEMARLKLEKKTILLIDEPTAGVAPVLRDQLSKSIKSLAQEHGHSIILVEHNLEFLFNLVDRVIVLVDGEKYMEGSPEQLKKDPKLQAVYFGAHA